MLNEERYILVFTLRIVKNGFIKLDFKFIYNKFGRLDIIIFKLISNKRITLIYFINFVGIIIWCFPGLHFNEP